MKVLFLTEGGNNIGFGHITRCLALSYGFKLKNIKSEFYINADDSAKKVLKNVKYKIFNWIENQNNVFKALSKFDFVVIDSYKAPRDFYYKVSSIMNGRILMIDDYNRIEYPNGIVVNPSIYGDKLRYPKKKDVKYLLGPKYIILRPEFWEIPKKRINKEIKKVLITFGATVKTEFINKIRQFIEKEFPYKVVVVEPSKKTLTAKEMLKLMLECDLCISGGGQTLYELARVGIPTIGICFAENQVLNLKYFKKLGLIEFAGWYNDEKVFLNLISKIKIYKSYEFRKKKYMLNKNISKIFQIDNIIYEVIKKIALSANIRNVKSSDIWKIYEISNDPEVRYYSVNSEKISVKEHIKWFNLVEKKRFYIAEINDKIILQVRFKEEKNADVISISTNKEFRGLGLTKLIFPLVIERYFNDFPNAKRIIAYIKKNNVISKKLFESNGFKKIKSQNFKLLKYVYEKQ
jgi:UDP-2,4-diacetamido-2,4,6-trideoxy-beta-L-altropyranose hydrolase